MKAMTNNKNHPVLNIGQGEKKRIKIFEKYQGIILCLPALILVIVIKLYPLIKGFALSLTTQESVGTNIFVGFENYAKLLTDKIFLISVVNILKAVGVLPIFVIIPLIIAFLLHRNVLGWRFFRSTYLYPYLLAPVMVGYMFSFILGPYGPINKILEIFGFEAVRWLGNPKFAIFTVFGVILWCWFGLGTIIYLASMSIIPEDLYEAAEMEGAKNRHILFRITIPHILPTVGYWSVLITTSFFIGLFPFIFALTEGGPGYATMMPEYYIYINATKFFDAVYASTLGVVLFVVIFFLSIIQIRFMYENE
jgi:ABC-type sugar transport system permease subunit